MSQRPIHYRDEQGLPPADLQSRLAADLVEDPNPLGRRILTDLSVSRKRLSELLLLDGGTDQGDLAQVLRHLRAEGLVDQRVDPTTPDDALVYELTRLGVDVVYAL